MAPGDISLPGSEEDSASFQGVVSSSLWVFTQEVGTVELEVHTWALPVARAGIHGSGRLWVLTVQREAAR